VSGEAKRSESEDGLSRVTHFNLSNSHSMPSPD
jgi:hypothetical protein